MINLTKQQIIYLHSLLIAETGGTDGIRDDGLLESAIKSPMQTFAGHDLYPTVQTKAAQLCLSLILNHPFVDGNKRIGVLSMMMVLELNGIEIETTDEAIIYLGLSVARGTLKADGIVDWIIENTK